MLLAGYAGFLLLAAVVLEWLSAHTHRRALRYRTAGFTYHEQHDHWQCPEGEHLWPHEFDHERRLVRYRAKAHICNGCPQQGRLHRLRSRARDRPSRSTRGRTRRQAASTAGCRSCWWRSRCWCIVVGAARSHAAADVALLVALLAVALAIGRWLLDRLPGPSFGLPRADPAHGLRSEPIAEDTDPLRWIAWTLIRFLHIVALAFFVGGQLHARGRVVPAVRRHGEEVAMRGVARRFGIGSLVAIVVLVATGAAMASHFARGRTRSCRRSSRSSCSSAC